MRYTKDHCFEDLKRRILATDLAPGLDLDEVGLTETYGISRTPLREVLQRLAGEGYIRLEANRGAKVASLDVAALRMFFQTAPLIYANMARLAAENRETDELDALKAAQGTFRAATTAGDASEAALSNHSFHEIIGQMARNPYLMAALDRLQIDHARMSLTFYQPASQEDTTLIATAADQHDAMIAAIETRDAALAVDLTLQHWDLSRNRLERFVRPDPLPVDVISMKEQKDAV